MFDLSLDWDVRVLFLLYLTSNHPGPVFSSELSAGFSSKISSSFESEFNSRDFLNLYSFCCAMRGNLDLYTSSKDGKINTLHPSLSLLASNSFSNIVV